jgi:methyl-accepting chemotaxis protein
VGPVVTSIVPIRDDQGAFSGTFEIGHNVQVLLDEIKEAYGIDGALYLNESTLREVATALPPGVFSEQNRVGNFIRFHATHPEVMSLLVGDADVADAVSDARTYERSVARVPWGVELVPLYDYSNSQIGVVALATNFGEDDSVAKRALVWQLLAALFGAVLLSGAILIVIRGWLLAPLAVLSERMSALAEGEESRPADAVESYCEELRDLAASYEKLRTERRS